MEIQRHGNDHLEVILDAHTSEGQKQEIAELDKVISNWKNKSSEAESCLVNLLCQPGQSSELLSLAEKKVQSLSENEGLSIELKSTDIKEREEDEPEDVEMLARKKSHLKDLIMLAIVDGQFDDEEKNTIMDIGTKMGFTERSVNSIYNECVLNPDHIPSVPSKDPHERLRHLADLCRVILADGKIADWESVLIIPMAVKMGFDANDVSKMLDELIDAESENKSDPDAENS